MLNKFKPWLELVADDLDADKRYTRPALESSDVPDGSRYNVRDNVIYIHIGQRTDAEIEYTIAHEMRHWMQHMAGWLRDVRELDMFVTTRYRARWHNHTVEYFAATQEQYQLLPWELDAHMYACDAMLRLQQLDTSSSTAA